MKKETLENRIRGWFPQEPKLQGQSTGISFDNGNVLREQDYYSLRMCLAKKTTIPFLGAYIGAIVFIWYLASNKLISNEMYFSTLILLGLCTSY